MSNIFQITDVDKLKFTKIRNNYRINFRYYGELYSLNLFEDGGDHSLELHNKSGRKVICSDCYETNVLWFIKYKYNKPIIYSHINKELFVAKLNEWIKENSN